MTRNLLRNPLLYLLPRNPLLIPHNHICPRHLGPLLLIIHPNHGRVQNLGVADQQRLQLRRRDLIALVFDEFLSLVSTPSHLIYHDLQ